MTRWSPLLDVPAYPADGYAKLADRLGAINDQVAAATASCGVSASCNLQAAMWGLEQQIGTIERYCPNGKFASGLSASREQLKDITTTCNQVISGGQCSPEI